jgi:hypothetical protein
MQIYLINVHKFRKYNLQFAILPFKAQFHIPVMLLKYNTKSVKVELWNMYEKKQRLVSKGGSIVSTFARIL